MATPANEQDCRQVHDLCLEVQEATGVNVEVAFVDQVYTGDQARTDAANAGIELMIVKRPGLPRALFFFL